MMDGKKVDRKYLFSSIYNIEQHLHMIFADIFMGEHYGLGVSVVPDFEKQFITSGSISHQ